MLRFAGNTGTSYQGGKGTWGELPRSTLEISSKRIQECHKIWVTTRFVVAHQVGAIQPTSIGEINQLFGKGARGILSRTVYTHGVEKLRPSAGSYEPPPASPLFVHALLSFGIILRSCCFLRHSPPHTFSCPKGARSRPVSHPQGVLIILCSSHVPQR